MAAGEEDASPEVSHAPRLGSGEGCCEVASAWLTASGRWGISFNFTVPIIAVMFFKEYRPRFKATTCKSGHSM